MACCDTTGNDLYYSKREFEWPWTQGYHNGSIAGLKMILSDGLFTFSYIFQNSVYRYTYDPNTMALTGKYLQMVPGQVTSANTTFDGHFVLAGADGTIYETDTDFGVMSEFKTPWKVKKLCKLYN